MSKYIVRFDDLTPAMDWQKFNIIKSMLEEYGIKSILGVVPNNKDPKLNIEKNLQENFFSKVLEWKDYGDTIAQHGYTHVYDSLSSGILNINSRSEFAGHEFKIQFERLKSGKQILQSHNVWEPYFMAPAHSFDINTINALSELGFIALTDGYGYFPYKIKDLIFIPQLASYPLDFGFGYHTLCIHINTMNIKQINTLMNFIKINKAKFVDFKDIVRLPINDHLLAKILRLSTYYLLKMKRSIG
ncbi:DUF2334 domain-containing protein [Acinetobacter gerneri]|uniref:DUF2334 domain-containing protein n=1 Tax=Acinetobacter gerneri TaxID=202952 RepID=UPI0029368E24|nr:DUF2334 domain-containing protein [Acinetobacter gerneri]MDV2440810.1 DUF2334 domain-containing protein [Acinetobacter gerneri]